MNSFLCQLRRRSRIAAWFAMTLFVAIVPAFSENAGVFLGVSWYDRDKLPTLGGPDYDANDISNAVVSSGIIRPEATTTLTFNVSKQDILDAISLRAHTVGSDETLLISFSGHGNTGVIEATDASITVDDLRTSLQGTPCGSVVLINDSCHSESFKLTVPGKKVAYMHAVSETQSATLTALGREKSRHLNGAFSKHVIQGLTNGNADLNGDGKLTSHELGEWACIGIELGEDPNIWKGFDKTIDRLSPFASRNSSRYEKCKFLMQQLEPGVHGDEVVLARQQPGKPWRKRCFVPYVVGMERANALQTLSILGIKTEQHPYLFIKGRPIGEAYADCIGAQKPGWEQSDWYTANQLPEDPRMIDAAVPAKLYVIPTPVAAVPSCVGMTVANAEAAIVAAGFKPYMTKKTTADPALPDFIGGHRPQTGERLVVGSYVRLYKTQIDEVNVPRLLGEEPAQAKTILKEVGLECSVVTLSPRSAGTSVMTWRNFPPGHFGNRVWRITPNEYSPVKVGSTVEVTVPTPVVNVPDINGMSEADARQTLAAVKLGMDIYISTQTNNLPAGVKRHSKLAYEGDIISVNIEYPEVPPLLSLSRDDVRMRCTEAMLQFQPAGDSDPTAVAVDQFPDAGRRAQPGDAVTVTYRKPEQVPKDENDFLEWLIKQLSIPATLKRQKVSSWYNYPRIPPSASYFVLGKEDFYTKNPAGHPERMGRTTASFTASDKNGYHSLTIGILPYRTPIDARAAYAWFVDPSRLRTGISGYNTAAAKTEQDIRDNAKKNNGNLVDVTGLGTAYPSNSKSSRQFFSEPFQKWVGRTGDAWHETTWTEHMLSITSHYQIKVIEGRRYQKIWSTEVNGKVIDGESRMVTTRLHHCVITLAVNSSHTHKQESVGNNSTTTLRPHPYPAALYRQLANELTGLVGSATSP